MKTVRLGRVLLVAAVSALIPLAGNVVAAVLTDWTGRAAWFVVPTVGVVVAVITALIDAYGGAGSGPPSGDHHRPQLPDDASANSRSAQDRRGTPLVVALLVAVVVIGIGGLGVAQGTRSLLISETDLPPGYAEERRQNFSSASECANHIENSRPAARSLRKTLTALGLERCEITIYRRSVAQESWTGSNHPGTQTFTLRDEDAASKFLPELRRLLLARIDPEDGFLRRHSVPAPTLGDEAPRGLEVTYSPDRNSGREVRLWAYLWRRANTVAWVGAGDVVGDFDRLATLALARTVDARISD